MGAIGALSAGPAALAAAATAAAGAGEEAAAEDLVALDGPMFVHVRDAAAGEVDVLVDEREVVFTDKALVAKLLRAASEAADMSSHREAPAISKDPVADNTDTYAFVTPGDTVTIITNYLPVEAPAGGPNFYEFGDDVAVLASTSTTTATACRT